MEALSSGVQSLAQSVVPMVVLLGLLIFVHELGHFLVAKYFKVKVETFSLGFGKKLLSFKRGDTVYAISAFPLGGYVKMFGDDPTAEINPEDRAVSFTHKPVMQRIAVVLAGPLMNFFFAIALFAGVAALGEQVLAPKVGDVPEKSAAYTAGFRDGDTVTSVSGEKVKTWEELQKRLEENPQRQIAVEVERQGTQEKAVLQVTPKLEPNKNVLSWQREVGEVDGLSVSSRASIVGVVDPLSPAAKAGLQTGDSVKAVNGIQIDKWRELESAIGKSLASNQPIVLDIERGVLDDKKADNPDKLKITLPAAASQETSKALAAWGIEFPELCLAGIAKGSPAEKAGLEKGDRLLTFDGKPVTSFEEVAGIVHSYGDRAPKGANPEPLQITVARAGKMMTFAVAPNIKEHMSLQGKSERGFEIGIHPMIVDATPVMTETKASGFKMALDQGVSQALRWTNLTVLSFWRLIGGEVSPKNIGGFLSIGQMAKRSWQIGASPFLNVMALISINLFILNLLPVPVLDGGHLVFYSIEAIKGAPLSMRKMEIAQQVGLVLLLALMVFAIFNDFSRIFFS